MTPTPESETCQRLSVRRSVTVSGRVEAGVTGRTSHSYLAQRAVIARRLPSRDAADEVHHVHPSRLLEQARCRGRALARPAVNDDWPLGDLGESFTQVLERDVDAAPNRLPPPFRLGAYVDQADRSTSEAIVKTGARDARRMSREDCQVLGRRDPTVEVPDHAVEADSCETRCRLLLAYGRADEDDRACPREQSGSQASEASADADVDAAGQVPPGEVYGIARIEELGPSTLGAQHRTERERLEIADEDVVECDGRVHSDALQPVNSATAMPWRSGVLSS